jgi:hypothetical protein
MRLTEFSPGSDTPSIQPTSCPAVLSVAPPGATNSPLSAVAWLMKSSPNGYQLLFGDRIAGLPPRLRSQGPRTLPAVPKIWLKSMFDNHLLPTVNQNSSSEVGMAGSCWPRASIPPVFSAFLQESCCGRNVFGILHGDPHPPGFLYL